MARHGENIRKRKDGRWEGRYKAFDENKRRTIYRSVYGKTYEDVKEKLFRIRFSPDSQAAGGSGSREKSGIGESASCPGRVYLFSQAAEQWLEEIKKKRKYSTYIKYRTVYQTHLEESVGACVLSVDKVPELYAKIFDHLSETAGSDSMQKSVCCVVNQILNFSGKNVPSDIPLLERRLVKEKRKSVEVLSGTEQERLLGCIYKRSDSFGIAVLLCLYAGLRLGELCALKWADLDFVNHTLTVNRTVQRIAREGYRTKTVLMETGPKSESSKRTIPLAPEMEALLIQFDNGQPYVFGEKKPAEPRTVQYRFQKILRESGIDRRKFHTLRHTFATNCVENGMDVKALSEILGHADVKHTLNRYVHPTMDSKRKQMDALSEFYGQICGRTA